MIFTTEGVTKASLDHWFLAAQAEARKWDGNRFVVIDRFLKVKLYDSLCVIRNIQEISHLDNVL